MRALVLASVVLFGCPETPADTDGPDTDSDPVVAIDPPLVPAVGSCAALLAPLPLGTPAEEEAARALVEALQPLGLPSRTGLTAVLEGAGDCATHLEGTLGGSWSVWAPDGCSHEGNAYIGALTWSRSSLRTETLTADGFAAHLATGEVVELDGALETVLSGYMVGNPPFRANVDLWMKVVGAELAGENHLALSKPAYEGDVTDAYLYHLGGEGPTGDFCFDATFDGKLLSTVSFD